MALLGRNGLSNVKNELGRPKTQEPASDTLDHIINNNKLINYN